MRHVSSGGDNENQFQTLHDALPDVKKHSMSFSEGTNEIHADNSHVTYAEIKSGAHGSCSLQTVNLLFGEEEYFHNWHILAF